MGLLRASQTRTAERTWGVLAGVLGLACTNSEASAPGGIETDAGPSWAGCTPAEPCASCNPAGTGGRVGQVVGDVRWITDRGDEYGLHSSCGVRQAVVLIETASWCSLCKERAPLLKQWQALYGPEGVAFAMVVGENQNAQPVTQADVARYREDLGLGEGFAVLADPDWAKVTRAVVHPAGVGALPTFAVLDASMTLRYLGDGGDKLFFPQVPAVLGDITGKAFVPAAGCAGSCGKLAPAGCWCDEFCQALGNCCPDNCDACGYCD